jgi:PPOX class probable F420-dependent enzyme
MDVATALAFIRQNHRAVIATTRADGTTQMSPVTAGVDDQDCVVISTRETAYKVRHLRALPYAALCAFPDRFFGEWVQVEGPVEIVSLPEAMAKPHPAVYFMRGPGPKWHAKHQRWLKFDSEAVSPDGPRRLSPVHVRRRNAADPTR